MIGPVQTIAELCADGRPTCINGAFAVNTLDALLAKEATEAARALGIDFQPLEFVGDHKLRIETATGPRTILRQRAFAAVTTDQLLDAPRAFIEHIHRLYGPGRVWKLGGLPQLVSDYGDNAVRGVSIGGVHYFLLRAYYGHENGPCEHGPGRSEDE